MTDNCLRNLHLSKNRNTKKLTCNTFNLTKVDKFDLSFHIKTAYCMVNDEYQCMEMKTVDEFTLHN